MTAFGLSNEAAANGFRPEESMGPEVVYFILCDEVECDPKNLLRIDVKGLLTRLRSTATPPFPVVRPSLSALLFLVGCQGTDEIWLRLLQADTGRVVFKTQRRKIRCGNSEELFGMVFHLEKCTFPAPGLYWVECIFSDEIIGRQRLWVTEA